MNKSKAKSIGESKILYFIIALFASFCLWVYVTSVEKVEVEETFSDIPVVFLGEDTIRDTRNLIITDSSASTVSVKLKGQRAVLSRLKKNKDDLTAVIDIGSITEPVNNRTSYTITYPEGITGLTVVSRSPSVIEYYVDKQSSRMIDVYGKFVGSVAEGHIAGSVSVDPLTVKISGPEQAIKQVAQAYVEVNRDDVDRTLEFSTSYVLLDEEGNEISIDSIELERDTVNVTIPVRASKEVALAVDLVAGGGAGTENVNVSIDPVSITVIGDAEILSGINRITLGSIDLSQVDQSFEATYPIVLDNDVDNQSGVTEATVKIEIIGLETKEFAVTDLSYINVPEGYTADIFTRSLQVKVRADEDTIDKIAANNIRAVADLSNYSGTEGDRSVPVKIYIDGYSDAGVVGNYTIYIAMMKDGDD